MSCQADDPSALLSNERYLGCQFIGSRSPFLGKLSLETLDIKQGVNYCSKQYLKDQDHSGFCLGPMRNTHLLKLPPPPPWTFISPHAHREAGLRRLLTWARLGLPSWRKKTTNGGTLLLIAMDLRVIQNSMLYNISGDIFADSHLTMQITCITDRPKQMCGVSDESAPPPCAPPSGIFDALCSAIKDRSVAVRAAAVQLLAKGPPWGQDPPAMRTLSPTRTSALSMPAPPLLPKKSYRNESR